MVSEMEWTHYIQEDPLCPHLRVRPSSAVSIFIVPKFLKDTKREAYVPYRVSLGPYHHGSAELPPMGHHKGRALRRMMTRFNANGNIPVVPNNMDFADRARAEILKLENEIRDSYEENIDYDGETLARMLCLDGCFLLEVLRTLSGDTLSRAEARKCYDPIFGERKLSYAATDVRNDLLILENQIPLIVLIKLLELESNSAVDVEKKLLNVVKDRLHHWNPFDNKFFDIEQCSCHHHLLGLLHTVITYSPASNEGERVDPGKCSICIDCCCSSKCISMLQGKSKARKNTKRIPHAVELRNAGIKFKQSDGGINNIKFDENSATIFLPPISIMDRTERVFRNLIAYEMCKPSERNYVISYVSLMNNLIDTEEDVAVMRRMGVLSNWIGSDKEVADLFNGLGKEIIVSYNDMFKDLKQNVSAHYRNKLKVQFAELARDHFSSPWKALALVGGIVALVLTALQTIYAMK